MPLPKRLYQKWSALDYGTFEQNAGVVFEAFQKAGIEKAWLPAFAHILVEVGNLKSFTAAWNYGNIKYSSIIDGVRRYWKSYGATHYVEYHDDNAGDWFLGFDRPEDGIDAYVNLLRTKYGVTSADSDPITFANRLKVGGYATKPTFAQAVFEKYEQLQFERPDLWKWSNQSPQLPAGGGGKNNLALFAAVGGAALLSMMATTSKKKRPARVSGHSTRRRKPRIGGFFQENRDWIIPAASGFLFYYFLKHVFNFGGGPSDKDIERAKKTKFPGSTLSVQDMTATAKQVESFFEDNSNYSTGYVTSATIQNILWAFQSLNNDDDVRWLFTFVEDIDGPGFQNGSLQYIMRNYLTDPAKKIVRPFLHSNQYGI